MNSMTKRRILWVKTRMPGLVKDGSSLVSLNLARCLSRVFDIDLVCLRINGGEDNLADNYKSIFSSIHIINPDNKGNIVKRLAYRIFYEFLSYKESKPRSVYYDSGRNISDCVSFLSINNNYDLAFFEYFSTAPLMAFARCKRCLLLHDANYITLKQQANHHGSLFKRLYLKYLSGIMLNYEKRETMNADRVFVISDCDKKYFQDIGIRNIEIIPVLLPPLVKRKRPLTGTTLVFLGAMNYLPNIDAVRWFVHDILPHIRKKRPDVKLKIIGAGLDEKEKNLLLQEDVEYQGWVDNLDHALDETCVAIAPLRLGTGVKIKVLDLMWHGLPMVVTSLASNGTPAELGGALVANTAQEFAEQVICLLNDFDLRLALRDRAWELLEARHCGIKVCENVMDVFKSLCV